MIDIYLAALVGGAMLAIFNPNALNEKSSEQAYALIVIFIWVFVEALLLATVGSTPGKALLKVRLHKVPGQSIVFGDALTRSLKVWWRGLGIGFPIATLITLAIAHRKLTTTGITSWDQDEGFAVTHEHIGVARTLLTILLILGFLALSLAESAANA